LGDSGTDQAGRRGKVVQCMVVLCRSPVRLGLQIERRRHRVSARNAFLRAWNYYRAAYIFMFALPVDPRVIEAYEKQTD